MRIEEVLSHLNRKLSLHEVGFIALVVTKWHALGLEAWLESARSNGYEESGVILLRPHSRFGLSVSRDDLPGVVGDDRVQVVPMTMPPKRFLVGRFPKPIRSVGRYIWLLCRASRGLKRIDGVSTLRVVSPFRANFDILTMLNTVPILNQYRISFVITDEGLASYFPPEIWRYSRMTADGTNRSGKLRDRCREIVQIVKDKMENRLLEGFEWQSRFLFSVDEDQALVPNPEIAADYRRVLESSRWRLNHSAIPRAGERPVALFLTQAWGANGELSTDAEVSTIAAVAKRLQGTPYVVVLKLHPHDNAEKYAELLLRMPNVTLMESSAVLERILPCLKPQDIVISYNSTALLNATVFYGIPSYTVGRELLDQPGTGPWFRDFHLGFLRLAKRIVRDLHESHSLVDL